MYFWFIPACSNIIYLCVFYRKLFNLQENLTCHIEKSLEINIIIFVRSITAILYRYIFYNFVHDILYNVNLNVMNSINSIALINCLYKKNQDKYTFSTLYEKNTFQKGKDLLVYIKKFADFTKYYGFSYRYGPKTSS